MVKILVDHSTPGMKPGVKYVCCVGLSNNIQGCSYWAHRGFRCKKTAQVCYHSMPSELGKAFVIVGPTIQFITSRGTMLASLVAVDTQS
jgi:hypothetical protein